MSVTTLASTSPRTAAIAAPMKRAPIQPEMLPNRAGQVGGVGIKGGIINNALGKRPRK